jgi:hypothetical protein
VTTTVRRSREPAVSPTTAAGERARLALAVASAVDRIEGVRRFGGRAVEIATQHRGGRVIGIVLAPRVVSVHLVAESLPLEPVLQAVRAAVGRVLADAEDGRAVSVHVEELDLDGLPRG